MNSIFFNYDFEPTKETVDEMISTIKELLSNNSIIVEEIENEFYEDEGELHSISFLTPSKKYRFTYDDDGEPCVDVCDKEGEIMVTLRPKNYEEFIDQIN